jgi:hypothetical protein
MIEVLQLTIVIAEFSNRIGWGQYGSQNQLTSIIMQFDQVNKRFIDPCKGSQCSF